MMKKTKKYVLLTGGDSFSVKDVVKKFNKILNYLISKKY